MIIERLIFAGSAGWHEEEVDIVFFGRDNH
jgi:hypothetical protein